MVVQFVGVVQCFMYYVEYYGVLVGVVVLWFEVVVFYLVFFYCEVGFGVGQQCMVGGQGVVFFVQCGVEGVQQFDEFLVGGVQVRLVQDQ